MTNLENLEKMNHMEKLFTEELPHIVSYYEGFNDAGKILFRFSIGKLNSTKASQKAAEKRLEDFVKRHDGKFVDRHFYSLTVAF